MVVNEAVDVGGGGDGSSPYPLSKEAKNGKKVYLIYAIYIDGSQ